LVYLFGEISMEEYKWKNTPEKFKEENSSLIIRTEKNTDMWRRTHYGFSYSNAPMYLTSSKQNRFLYQLETIFNGNFLFDQCGIIVYMNDDNWAKFSSEYENEKFQRLGGVVTKNGYSDWSTQNIPATVNNIHYRISREGNDFIVSYSLDGNEFTQMRIFNLSFNSKIEEIKVGMYACSPQGEGFLAKFKNPHFL